MPPLTPMLIVATEKKPNWLSVGMSTMPVPPTVAARAMMSGTGVLEDEKSSVFRPEIDNAGALLSRHAKRNCTSVGATWAVAIRLKTKLCAPPGAIVTGVFAVPIGWLVAGLVLW